MHLRFTQIKCLRWFPFLQDLINLLIIKTCLNINLYFVKQSLRFLTIHFLRNVAQGISEGQACGNNHSFLSDQCMPYIHKWKKTPLKLCFTSMGAFSMVLIRVHFVFDRKKVIINPLREQCLACRAASLAPMKIIALLCQPLILNICAQLVVMADTQRCIM